MQTFLVGYRGVRVEVEGTDKFAAKHAAFPLIRARFDLFNAPRSVSDLLVWPR